MFMRARQLYKYRRGGIGPSIRSINRYRMSSFSVTVTPKIGFHELPQFREAVHRRKNESSPFFLT
jgi:hypothetical protein